MDIQLDKLSWKDRFYRFLAGNKTNWLLRNSMGKKRKLSKEERELDIIVWNVVRQNDIDIVTRYGDHEVEFGGVHVTLNLKPPHHVTKISVKGKGVSISKATASYISQRLRDELERVENEKKAAAHSDIKQKLYEDFVESKGL